MIQFLKDRWLLLIVLIVFIIVRIPVLNYPFYWDESWSYAPGVKLMYLHGPSLMPNAIDLFYSRGHPLLFYASAAAWMHIFGDSHTAQHSFALFISLLLLISIYEVTFRLFGKRVAIISLLLVATQEVFFVQSTLLLPEVMISWLMLLTLYYYASGKYLLTTLACTALMFTKESGMVLGLVLGVHSVIYLFSKNATADKVKNLLSVLIPGIIICIFFIVQKKLNGWYLFPEHTSLIDLSWIPFKNKMRFSVRILFCDQYRNLLYIFLAIASAIAAGYYRNLRYALPLFFAILLYIYIGDYIGYIPRKILIPFIWVAFIYATHILIKLDKDGNTKAHKFVYLTICFLLAYNIFSCLNFFTYRYLLCSILLFLVLAAYSFEVYLRPLKNIGFYALIGCILLTAGISFTHHSADKGDVNFNAFPAMRVQQDVVTYLEQHNLYNEHIATHSDLQTTHLTQPYTGFLSSTKVFSNITYDIGPKTGMLIIDNIQPGADSLTTLGYKPIYRSQHDQIWSEIYMKN